MLMIEDKDNELQKLKSKTASLKKRDTAIGRVWVNKKSIDPSITGTPELAYYFGVSVDLMMRIEEAANDNIRNDEMSIQGNSEDNYTRGLITFYLAYGAGWLLGLGIFWGWIYYMFFIFTKK